jgi:hypothetical protein
MPDAAAACKAEGHVHTYSNLPIIMDCHNSKSKNNQFNTKTYIT